MIYLTCFYHCIFIFLGSCALACILTSPHPRISILIFVCTCLYPRIPTCSYPQVHTPLLASCILVSSGSCALACILASSHPHILKFISVSFYTHILASSYPQIRGCLLVSLHHHILISSGSCVLAGILPSSHSHILRLMCACWYPRIATSSYPQFFVCLLVCSHPQINAFLIQMN